MMKLLANRRRCLLASVGFLMAGFSVWPGLGDEPTRPTPAVAARCHWSYPTSVFCTVEGALSDTACGMRIVK
jgi:hypothetical protein